MKHSIVEFIGKLLKPMPPKDPTDWTLTRNSKKWRGNSYCPNCKLSTEHSERMAEICNKCGHHSAELLYRRRSSRKIWNGNKWVIQHKYGNGPEDYTVSA